MRTMMCFYRSVRFVPDDELQELSSWKLALAKAKPVTVSSVARHEPC